jgi:hypothetical protein
MHSKERRWSRRIAVGQNGSAGWFDASRLSISAAMLLTKAVAFFPKPPKALTPKGTKLAPRSRTFSAPGMPALSSVAFFASRPWSRSL